MARDILLYVAGASILLASLVAMTKDNLDALVEEIMVGCWSMQVGFIQVARQRYSRHLVNKGVDLPFPLDVEDTIVQAKKGLLKSYPWAEPITDVGIENACQLLIERNLR